MNQKYPTHESLRELMEHIGSVVFPEYYDTQNIEAEKLAIRSILACQPKDIGKAFVESLPEIARLLHTDVEAVAHNDPAVTDNTEIVLCYPAIRVMTHYRTAHRLYELGVPVLPRMITEMAHSNTGVDIHPAAQIGEYFAIDHGTGIVIGATSIIGNHVMLYQGVTLGARNFSYDESGHPRDIPRHPILEDNVTVYSNASILGRVRIGHDSVIGGNVWLTHDVPAHSHVLQGKAIEEF